ncbi:hypothetical protein C4D60_Mb03t07010 [Musa balbisiana]|uniref:Glycosyl hydrolase family 13 catalytic domain-containing protein n=1 Tax=Musa balbisiana TaxID=52838 RepID=A0A4S8J879_MUSBA|nr:hypothetical protein C4D60_Mb03t07010 [Musa balbisiana]
MKVYVEFYTVTDKKANQNYLGPASPDEMAREPSSLPASLLLLRVPFPSPRSASIAPFGKRGSGSSSVSFHLTFVFSVRETNTLQGFNWESWRQQGGWYNFLKDKVSDIANAGVTHVWLPPPSRSVGVQGRSVIRICRRDHSHMLTESALV